MPMTMVCRYMHRHGHSLGTERSRLLMVDTQRIYTPLDASILLNFSLNSTTAFLFNVW